MQVVRVNSQEFGLELKKLNQVHSFNLADFAMLNNIWVDEIHFLLFQTKETILAITLGERNAKLLSPFSAPFGGFSFLRDDISISIIQEALELLQGYGRSCNCKDISLTLPPLFYAPNFLTKLVFCCYLASSSQITDINYHLNLSLIGNLGRFNRNYWRNIKKGESNNLFITKCVTSEELELCYSIIEENRVTQGYSLKMGLHQFLNTSKIIDIDFFLLGNQTESFASAICYWVSPHIIQIVYWGDYTFKRGQGAMHQISTQLQDYYKNLGVEIIDVGPSTVNGKPNVGLCDFKEGIGCDISLKLSFVFKLNENPDIPDQIS